MIYIGIINVEKINEDNLSFLSEMPIGIIEKIKNTKNKKEKKLRIGAYSVLAELYKILMGKDVSLPEIFYTGEGKPHFNTNNDNNSLPRAPVFSLSHDGVIACVSISDDCGEVGIDVQTMPRRRIAMERIAERFFAPFSKAEVNDESNEKGILSSVETKIFFYDFIDGKISTSQNIGIELNEIPYSSVKDDFIAKWTLLEATLKMSGAGIGCSEDIKEKGFAQKTKTFSFSVGVEKYALTVAEG
jgi:phosphopantetheinyl transferase